MANLSEDALQTQVVDLVNGVTDGAFIANEQLAVLQFNRPLMKLHGILPRELKKIQNSHCRQWIDLEICEKSCIVRKCLEVGSHVRFDEVKGVTKSGDQLTLIVSAIPIRDVHGKIVSVLEMHRNVTDEAQIHEKYKVLLDKEKRAKEEAEKLVEIRTRELRKANEELKRAETQLVHSEKMSSLGQMVAGLAHELNNPINFICGNVDVLEEYVVEFESMLKALSDAYRQQPDILATLKKIEDEFEALYKLEDMANIARSIRKGSERAADVIQGLRTFSRLDEAQFKETDIHQDIDTTLMLLRNQYKDRIEIHKNYGDIGLFRCFASQLNQVYMNLLQNAIQAIEGRGDIWITTYRKPLGVVVEIRDSGQGIDPDTISKIFDPFFTTKAIGEGTGLGLAVTYGIVERHGGKIEVASEVGQGTTFTVFIPHREDDEESIEV